MSSIHQIVLSTPAVLLLAATLGGARASEPTGRASEPGAQAGNAGDWKTYDYRADGLQLRLPGDWLPMPEAAIREFSEQAANQLPGMTAKVQFKYAFQRGPINQWFQTPYILVDIRPGRPAWRQLKALARPQRPQGEKASQNAHTEPSVFKSMPIGAVLFDKEKNVVWMNLSHRLRGDRSARCASALLPTKLGVIQINMYALEDEAPQYLKLFEEIALNARLDPSIAYKRYPFERLPLLDRLDWANPGMRYAEIMLVTLVAILFVASVILAQRKNVEKMKAPD